MMPHSVVGIDVAKNWLDVAIDDRVKRINNTVSALQTLADEFIAQGVTVVGMEPTGGYERLAGDLSAFIAAAVGAVIVLVIWRAIR
jgi:transposase